MLPHCFLCGKILRSSQKGITIKGYHICESCEKKITKLSVDDSYYDKIVEKIKEIWQKKMLCI